mmetsp:Transcript_8049/g.19052  ORF Transcript_8049/g.19052 Transcript_8049/m.19052 type:complete len:218 (+) Transcript_8049:739-1392(+)
MPININLSNGANLSSFLVPSVQELRPRGHRPVGPDLGWRHACAGHVEHNDAVGPDVDTEQNSDDVQDAGLRLLTATSRQHHDHGVDSVWDELGELGKDLVDLLRGPVCIHQPDGVHDLKFSFEFLIKAGRSAALLCDAAGGLCRYKSLSSEQQVADEALSLSRLPDQQHLLRRLGRTCLAGRARGHGVGLCLGPRRGLFLGRGSHDGSSGGRGLSPC